MLTLLCGADRLTTSAALLCAVRTRAEAVTGDFWASDPACYLTDEEIGL